MTKVIHDMTAPRRSKRVDHLKIVGDNDVWVEKKRRVHHNWRIVEHSYFQSVKTKRCKWFEPPTGASHVVYLCELHRYPADLQAFALE
jgi:hypothetical protein